MIAQHPAINHAVILREVRLLRERFDIFTVSVRAPDRQPDHLSEEERDEFDRTFYVKPQGPMAALAALSMTLWANPLRCVSGMLFAIRLAGGRPRQILHNLAYFGQAVVVGRWMLKNSLKHLHTHYSSTVALLVQKTFPVGISISFHGPDEFADPAGFWIRGKVEACTFVRAISNYARSQIMEATSDAQWDKIKVVYMGVDPRAYTPRPFRRHAAPIEILCVGRLAPVKAQRVLIAATDLLRKTENVLLHLVGGGPDRQALEQEIAARGLGGNVIIHGFTPQDQLDLLYRQADIFALPSLAEGVPGVLMEAMALEIPCVATSIAGVPELIRDGVDGLLVEPSNIQQLADALRKLIADPDLREQIGRAGRERILDRFDLRKNSSQLGDLMERYL